MGQQIFALAIGAQRQTGLGTETRARAGGTICDSKTEARGKAIELAEREFPKDEGWHSHWGLAEAIPQEWCRRVS